MTTPSSDLGLDHGTPSEEGLPYSSYVRAGDFIYLSGLVAMNDELEIVSGGIRAETDRIFELADKILRQAGSSLGDVVKVTICLPEPSDFDAFNDAYRAHFPSKPPARATFCAGLTIGAKVEMEFIAYQPGGPSSHA